MSHQNALTFTHLSDVMPVASPKAYGWILHPALDYFFCCGGFVALLCFVVLVMGHSIGVTNVPDFALWTAWIVGVHFFADSHSTAAWQRVFFDEDIKKRSGRYIALCTVLCLLMIPAEFIAPWSAGVMARIYGIILVKHFIMQSYGVVMIYCYKREFKLSKDERNLVSAVFQATMIYMIVRILTFPEFAGSKYFSIDMPPCKFCPEWFFLLVQSVLTAFVIGFVAMVARRYFKTKELFPAPALFLIATTVCLFGTSVSIDPRLSILISAYYHGSQNMCVILAGEVKKRGLPADVPLSKIATQLWTKPSLRYFLFLISVGLLLFVILPRIAATALGVSVDLAVVAALTCFGAHHILIEAVSWRLRDPKVRELLI